MSESSNPSTSAPPATSEKKKRQKTGGRRLTEAAKKVRASQRANVLAARAAREARVEKVRVLLQKGTPILDIAAAVGLTDSGVYLIRKKLRLNGGGGGAKSAAASAGVDMGTLVIARKLRKLAAEAIVQKGGDAGELELTVLNFVQHLLRRK
jgi:hypothetical protein